MNSFTKVLTMLVVTALLPLVGRQYGHAQYATLSERTLASITGLDDDSQTITASQACAYATIEWWMVIWTDCAGGPEGTDCLRCFGSSSTAKVPNSAGGPGITATGGVYVCTNFRYDLGRCINGVCDEFTPGGSCFGDPAAYKSQ